MSKYYTPEIEEFHIGYECEYYNPYSKMFIPFVVEESNFYFDEICGPEPDYIFKSNYGGDDKSFRTKYLDKEDIESLGFKKHVHSYGVDFKNKTHKISWWFDNQGIEIRQTTKSGIGEKCIFSGRIKNKSELKKLLKQLNIK